MEIRWLYNKRRAASKLRRRELLGCKGFTDVAESRM